METIEEWAEYISELIFGPTPTEQLRRAKREIERAVRRVQNDKLTYDNKEKNAINQLKMKAKTAAAPSDLLPLAQDIARARAASARLHKIIMTMDGVQINLTANHSLATLSNATKMATDALKACNSITSAQNVQEYEKELMKFEVASDMFEDLSEQDGEKEDAALLLAQIADEQSIALQFELPGANCSRECYPIFRPARCLACTRHPSIVLHYSNSPFRAGAPQRFRLLEEELPTVPNQKPTLKHI